MRFRSVWVALGWSGWIMAKTVGHQLAWAACVASMVLATASVVQAQDGDAQADARRQFTQGEQAYRVGNYDEAVELWQRAYSMDPRPRIQYNLSQAFERLGRLEEAVAALDAYLRDTPPDDPLYGEANARLAALRQRVALTGIRIVGGGAGGQIFVNDQAWGATPRPDRIPVAPGSHRITIVDPDGTRHELVVAVPVGQVVDVTVPTDSNPVPVVADGEETVPMLGSTADADSNRHILLWAGAGGAAVGLGVLFYGIERQRELSGCSDAGFVCLEESTVKRQRTLGMVLGGVLVAAGATLIVLDLLSSRQRQSYTDVELGIGFASLSLTVRR